MSNFRRIVERFHMDRGAKRRSHAMIRRARRGDTNAIAWLKAHDTAEAKRKTRGKS